MKPRDDLKGDSAGKHPRGDHYWDQNLDPANLGADVQDSAAALRREVEFARLTPDICAMLDHMVPVARQSGTIAPSTDATFTPNSPPLILDVGSGLGTAAVLLSDRGASVIALDVSHRRLATMRQAFAGLGAPSRRIFAVKARAEALPFRPASLDGACSRAVLIHTDIPAAADEIARVLRPGAPAAFSEVMAWNPLVNIYRRTLTPREWQSITTYFTDSEIDTVATRFDSPRHRRFYQLSFLAYIFQYAFPSRTGFRLILSPMLALDRFIARAWPGYRRFAWFVLITGKNRRNP